MKPIGPYVAARDLTGERPSGAVRTLHATDRLTGMPVLLHMLPHAAPLPELPDDPALLRPSEGGIDGDVAYVVTELPPHARPATDPLLAARGALAGLSTLHAAGLSHGGVARAQLWSVDGRVALAGAGLPWGGEASPGRDLHDLADTLRALGGVPPALRDAPAGATARDLLARLDAPPPAGVTRGRDPAPRVRAVTERETQKEEAAPEPAPPEPRPAADPAPTRLVVAAAPGEPVRQESGEPPAGEAPAPGPAQEEAGEAASGTASPRPTTGRVPARRRPGEPVRITWDADGTRHVVKPGQAAPAPRRRGAPGWLLPLLALLLLLLLLGTWWARRSAASPAAAAPVAASTAAPACCEVRFAVQGAEGVPVRLSIVSAPQGAGVTRGQAVGQAPGVVRLPRPGDYTLRVAAEGYTPGTVRVEAPSSVPVRITLTP